MPITELTRSFITDPNSPTPTYHRLEPLGTRSPLTPEEEIHRALHPDEPLGPDLQGMEPLHRVPRARRRPHGKRDVALDQTIDSVEEILVSVPHWNDIDGYTDPKTKEFKWIDAGALWDQITLGEYTFTGTVRIEGDGPRLSVDRRKKKGSVHTRLISNGYDTTELKIILRVWEPEHLKDFQHFVAKVNPKRSGIPYPVEVYHPMLRLAKIEKVLIYGVGFLQATGIQGLRECTLSCFEFLDKHGGSATARVVPKPNEPAIDPFFHTNHDNPRAAPTPSGTGANP